MIRPARRWIALCAGALVVASASAPVVDAQAEGDAAAQGSEQETEQRAETEGTVLDEALATADAAAAAMTGEATAPAASSAPTDAAPSTPAPDAALDVALDEDTAADDDLPGPYDAHREAIDAWNRKVDLLELRLATGQQDGGDADLLFGDVSAEFWPRQAAVHRAIHDDAPDLIAQHDELVELYAVRSRIFPLTTTELRTRLTGLNNLGRAEARRELDYFFANVEYQRHILARASGHLLAGLRGEPLAALGHLFQIFFAVLVFRWWRRWAKDGLPAMRQSILAARPRGPSAVRRARWVSYFDQIRRPLEWLALAWIIFDILQPAGFEDISILFRTVIKWLFIGAVAVRLIGAMTSSGSLAHAELRTRSLHVVGVFGVMMGLALDLTARNAGTGVMYTWVVRAGFLLALPLALLLVHWWRGPIFDRLEVGGTTSTWAARLAARRKGLGSYTAALLGSGLLIREGVLHLIVRLLSGSEFGRRLIAQLVRREVARDGEREGFTGEVPIADEIILPLIAAREGRIDEIAKVELGLMKASIDAHSGGARAVIGERGAGKTIFLERLAERFDGAMRIVDCPLGGYEALETAIADVLEIEPGGDFAARMSEALDARGIRVLGVDNFHRLPRPYLGGQAETRRLAELSAALETRLSWVFALDKRSWRYVLLAGGERALLHDTIELPMWTEEQVAALVQQRAAAIGIAPDYEKLVLPRQLDAGEHDDDQTRNRFGHARILWELADGNPEVALYLFAESLRRMPDDRVIPRLPQLSSPGSLVDAHPDALLVLRVLVQSDVASADDVARSLQMPIARVEQVLGFCAENGWVVDEHGGHRVSWRWFRSVTRALIRQNLMAR